jgi:hypothetical protein
MLLKKGFKMALTYIDNFLDSIPEEWMRNTFVDRLDSARLLVDDGSFGDMEGANTALGLFMGLSTEERIAEINRLRLLNTVDQWANSSEATVTDINSIITSLRTIRDAKQAEEQTPETPTDNEDTETPTDGE